MECPKKIAVVLSIYLIVGCVYGFTDPCSLENAKLNWCYNQTYGTCDELCNGASFNNISLRFCSKEKCETFFSREKVCKPLTYSSDRRCLSRLIRWTYDEIKNVCDMFYYGGCDGSENNFVTESACKQKCVQDPPLITCTEKWCYDVVSGECNETSQEGLSCYNMSKSFCGKDDCNTFYSREYVCRPLTYTTDQRCKAFKERWTYVEKNNACEIFKYGGCGGTENNFESKSICQRKCVRDTRAALDLATLYGIIIGVLVAVGILVGVIIFIYCHRRRRQKKDVLRQQATNVSAVKSKTSYEKQTKSPEFDKVCYTSIDKQKVEKA